MIQKNFYKGLVLSERQRAEGFSLIELLVVIAITALILAVALPNYLGARQRAMDTKKKNEMQALKQALRLYYNDHQHYPAAGNCSAGANYIKGCGVNGDTCCPCTSAAGLVGQDFAVGTDCTTIYIKKFPTSFSTDIWYYSDGKDSFCLKTKKLENLSDPIILQSRSRCQATCQSFVALTDQDYAICND